MFTPLFRRACLLAACAVLSSAYGARAQQIPCADHDALIERLGSAWGEQVTAIAITQDGSLMEILVNAETGTWTVAITLAEGLACVMAVGTDFAAVEPALEDDPT